MLTIGLLPLLSLAAEQELPKDVGTFLAERESCDHWRGEEGYDEERRAEIDRSICQSCPGTDSKLSLLKKKYLTNKAIMDKLAELEPWTEPNNKGSAAQFCSSLKKPKSLGDDQ